jgi:hypothetical protein
MRLAIGGDRKGRGCGGGNDRDREGDHSGEGAWDGVASGPLTGSLIQVGVGWSAEATL